MTDFSSPYYPYEKVQTGSNTFCGAEDIPLKLVKYLLDLPDQIGYTPVDDNTRPRVRLAKYLWYDGENPLAQTLPTAQEKLSLLFDGEHPVLNTDEEKNGHPKGYRLFPQAYWGQSELTAQTIIKCHIGRVIPKSAFLASIGIAFEIWCNVNQENTTRTNAYSRAYAIEQCIIEALNGVNITGIGVCDFSRLSHSDNSSISLHDEGTHVGRGLHLSISWAESGKVLS